MRSLGVPVKSSQAKLYVTVLTGAAMNGLERSANLLKEFVDRCIYVPIIHVTLTLPILLYISLGIYAFIGLVLHDNLNRTGEIENVFMVPNIPAPLREVASLIWIIAVWPYVLFRVSLKSNAESDDDEG
jgi:hypothetical protein